MGNGENKGNGNRTAKNGDLTVVGSTATGENTKAVAALLNPHCRMAGKNRNLLFREADTASSPSYYALLTSPPSKQKYAKAG